MPEGESLAVDEVMLPSCVFASVAGLGPHGLPHTLHQMRRRLRILVHRGLRTRQVCVSVGFALTIGLGKSCEEERVQRERLLQLELAHNRCTRASLALSHYHSGHFYP